MDYGKIYIIFFENLSVGRGKQLLVSVGQDKQLFGSVGRDKQLLVGRDKQLLGLW